MVYGVTKSWTQMNDFHSLTHSKRKGVCWKDGYQAAHITVGRASESNLGNQGKQYVGPAPENVALNILHIVVGTTGEAEHTAATKACTTVGQWHLHFWTLVLLCVCAQLCQTL